jgi:hypothetical protein
VPETEAPDRAEPLARGVFVFAEACALVFYVVISRPMWFYLDEWDFLANRTGGNLGDLFRPHNEHWVTLGVLVYRALWWVFGLRTYRPYQLAIIVAHLGVAYLLRAVMRRVGVRPWTATVVALVLVFFGSGYQNIVLPFQMTLVGSLAFGLVDLLLATRDRDAMRSLDRHDFYALAAGCAALMCSGVGVSMVVTVGVAVLVLRGWRLALFHTVPLAAVYVTWYIVIGHTGYTGYRAGLGQIASFTRTFVAATFDAVGHYHGFGWLLGALLVGGLVLAWFHLGRAELRYRAALPVALLVGALTMLLITGFGRAGASTFREKSRYLYLVAAMLLPAIGVAADAVMRRSRLLVPIVVAVLVAGVPSNVNLIVNYMHRPIVVNQTAYKNMMLSVPRIPLAKQVPRDVKPEQTLAHFVSVGWLLDGVASGRIPRPRSISAADLTMDELRLSFIQTFGKPDAGDLCVSVSTHLVFDLLPGQRIKVRAPTNTLRLTPPGKAILGTYPFLMVTVPPVGGNLVAIRPVRFRLSDVSALVGQVCAQTRIMKAAQVAGALAP